MSIYYILSTCGTVRQFEQSHENILLQASNLFGNVFWILQSHSPMHISPRDAKLWKCSVLQNDHSDSILMDKTRQNPAPTRYWKSPIAVPCAFILPNRSDFFSRMITISDQRPVDHLRSILPMASIAPRNRTRCIVHVQRGYMSIWYRSYYYTYTVYYNKYVHRCHHIILCWYIYWFSRSKWTHQHSLVGGLHCTQVETIVPLAKLSKKRSVWKLKQKAVRLRLRQTTTNKKTWHTQLDHPVLWWGSLVKQTRIQLQEEFSTQQTAGSSRLDIGSSFLHDYLGFAKVQKFTAGL